MSETLSLPGFGRISCDPLSHEEVTLMYREIFIDEEYGRHGISYSPGSIIIDAGANIGMFSIWASRACGGSQRIFAFEPVPATFAHLERNLAAFDAHGVEVFRAALGRIGGPASARITVYPGFPASSTLDPKTKALELERVSALALASVAGNKFLERRLKQELAEKLAAYEVECSVSTISALVREKSLERIDVLKIDVEGAELEVLEGIEDGIWPTIEQVMLETLGEERARELESRLVGREFAQVVIEKPAWAVELGLDNFNIYARR